LHQSNGFYPAGSQVPTSDWLYPAAIENSYWKPPLKKAG
jgi:hypothetical protein